jgi:hypothetical protein
MTINFSLRPGFFLQSIQIIVVNMVKRKTIRLILSNQRLLAKAEVSS